MKFYERQDTLATGKLFCNESRQSYEKRDILLVEILTTKLSISQVKTLLPPLISLSTRLLIHSDTQDPIASLTSTLTLLLAPLREAYDLEPLKGYEGES